MSNFYIYKFDYTEKIKKQDVKVSATVIFCEREDINQFILASEIKTFYEKHYQTDKVFVIGRESLEKKLEEVIINKFDETFKYIPRRNDTHLRENLYILTFDIEGKLKLINQAPNVIPEGFSKGFLNEGLQNIFIERGGLIHSPFDSHHFVFPSGKHCDKFLRTGNILLVSSEIYFIALALLKSFDEKKHTQIYCDSSSINSIAFALIELKNRFLEDKIQIPIESFSSYEGLYKNDLNYKKNALLLVSASTSANIISRIKEKHAEIDLDNILILYFLGKNITFPKNTICNLTESSVNPNGIPEYKTYKADDCELCKKGSFAVEVKGDVFSIEKPKINKILLTTKDPNKGLSDFVKQFKSEKKGHTILKTHYKENSQSKYEIFIDYSKLLNGVENGKYIEYKEKIDDYINQYVPSNLKYIISLEDEASKALSNYIYKSVESNYQQDKKPTQISQDHLQEIKEDEQGAILVTASCISNGKNLLYISRALRKHDKLRVTYFIGIARTKSKEFLDSLKKNLKQGTYGPDNSSFIEIESVFCENKSKDSSWICEIDFIKKIENFLKDNFKDKFQSTLDFLNERKKTLERAGGDTERGLSEKLFFPRFLEGKNQELEIRKNFAFFNFKDYVGEVAQSDIYFTISNILNGIRYNSKEDRSFKQTTYVRNIIDPNNFNRFNDGIIQASILRASYSEELAYALDNELSTEMTGIIETLIKYHNEEQGEALIEFLYAIATKKLTLRKSDLEKIVLLIDQKCKYEIFMCFKEYIINELIEK